MQREQDHNYNQNLFNAEIQGKSLTNKVKYIETFAIPTVSEMFSILPMFSGSPYKIAEIISNSLKKSKDDRTDEEDEEVNNLISSVFKTEENIEYFEGKETKKEFGYILLCDNSMVSASAEAPQKFIKNKEGLITYIKKTYGPEGLKHFLGILIALEEMGRKGICKISINEHLHRLGYKKKSSGTYDIELKKIATQIIWILSSLYVTIINKKSPERANIKSMKLFNLEKIDLDIDGRELTNNSFYITTTGWYNEAFLSNNKQSPKYNRLLKNITHENHLNHSITIYLSTILTVFWRMNPNFEIKVSNLMDWCDLDTVSRNRTYYLKKLEKELDYMKEKEYIGNWRNKYSELLPSDSENSFNCVLIIEPPVWLNVSLKEIDEKNKKYVFIEDCKGMSLEDFNKYYESSNLTIKGFCEKADITPRMFHLIRTGERSVSENLGKKVLIAFSM